MTPEEKKAAQRAKQAAWQRAFKARMTPEQRAAYKAKRRAYDSGDAARAKKNATNKRYMERLKEARPEKVAEILERNKNRKRMSYVPQASYPYGASFSGSVLASAAPSDWRDILAEITRKVGRQFLREDIIAEASLLAVEGMSVDQAVAEATVRAKRFDSEFKFNSTDFAGAYWLGEPAAFSEDMP